MTVELGDGYLSGLPEDQRDELTRVNAPGLTALREYLSSGQAVAFLGAGVSRPLYPLWDELIGELVDASADRLTLKEQATCRALAKDSPEAVVEIVRRGLGPGVFREALRGILRVQTDPESGRSWTPVQELICRCPFKAVVTTNYDPGIVDARMRVRPTASATGFMTWEDELGLDRWRSGDVFGEAELPVLFAHGQHNRPDSVVLATTEYRRAYAGKLPHVLARLMDGHMAWIGFSFADQRISAILREIADRTGTRVDPGGAPRHVALMAWDPAAPGNDPGVLAQQSEIQYGAEAVLHPAPGTDHSALARLLSALTDPRFLAVRDLPARAAPSARVTATPRQDGTGIPVTWEHNPAPTEHFTGRAEELARLDRWAADSQVALIAVTAWGGAGKTSLVTHWMDAGGATQRPGIRGVFGWSFYADPSTEHWAGALLEWAQEDLGYHVDNTERSATTILQLLRAIPLLLVLDGLEVMQEGPTGEGFGRLLDGTLREVLAGACQARHSGLVVLTSRFSFADLETFEGASARILEVPPFTPADGSALLAAAGGDWLPDSERRAAVQAVDGHALAVGILAGLLAAHLPASDLADLHEELATAARTDTRVGRVLRFYADRLSETDRYMVAAVSLFAQPVLAAAVLTVADHDAFNGHLGGWTPEMVQTAANGRLSGLVYWHPDGTVSAHPLVRDAFRPLVIAAAEVASEVSLTGLPEGTVTSRAAALRVVEAVELLLDAGQWQAADELYRARADGGRVLVDMPAARLGQRAESAFVATSARREACLAYLGGSRLGFYLDGVGLHSMRAGDMATARQYLLMAVRQYRDANELSQVPIALSNLCECLGHLGEPGPARDAAAEGLVHAQEWGDPGDIRNAHSDLAWVAELVGDPAEAEQQFIAADRVELASDTEGDHLYSLTGTQWAEWLIRTERPGPAERLMRRNLELSESYGWNDDVAHSHQMLGRVALTTGDTESAGEHFEQAARCFRDGDLLTYLAAILADVAEHARVIGDLDAAERYATEAITIAAPRGLVAAQSAALAARARIRASQAVAAGSVAGYTAQGRDAADAALRLATRHQLAWHELDALRACAELDRAEGRNGGWAAQADALHKRLVPPGLDADPLATAERLVAEQKAAEEANDENEGDE
jgi:tetratricopeptide (TPR) repeat protein